MVKQKKKKAPAKKVKKKQKKKSFFITLCKWSLILSLWTGIFLSGVVLWFAKDLPDITNSATFERRSSIIVKASNGSIIARYGESKGKNIDVSELPKYLIQAVLAIEDRRFYSHPGVDILGIARAMAINLYKGRFVQGGSTITQQLAKNLFLTNERKITRKIQEALLAIWLERELSKDEILSAYMNRVYLGSGTYGFEAASQLYFNKSAKNVNLREATVLAGLLKAPSRYSPHNNAELAKRRSETVLSAMEDAGYITQSDMTPSNLLLYLPHRQSKTGQNARYFTDWVIDELDNLVGRPDMDIVVETTLDMALQKRSQNTLVSAIDKADEKKYISQGAILVMSPNGSILSMVGGYSYAQSQFNRTTQARRPPGSAFKPIVYLTAIEKGFKPKSKILDAPITKGEYSPKNFAKKYYGKTDLETALTKSMNTASVRLAKNIGISSIIKTAKRLGITSKLERDLSLALGSSGISMIELGTAYAILANGGNLIYPYAITKISNKKGRVLFKRKQPKSHQSIVKRKHVNTITAMMRTVINDGTGKRAKLPFPASGKTGTSQNSRDAWFVGYTDKMVSIVWLGNDDNSPMRNITGGGLPAQIWKDVMLYGNKRHKSIIFNNNKNMSSLLGRLLSNNDNNRTDKAKPRKNDYSRMND